ncbi:unnamed protein product [Vitrella brassicaformis CCMP3155]|uniref:Uncharacterized protein n=1 Tax=Vitrella brassicaformis (strain CCMP3155) TaxID=1169540 RepID=A0A0G4G7Y1_VITBC|nr:unnamed protein product [Vitrella brassicaformis CCMP3155]|mmetsp:Transcript_36237/g.103978  ORF Transcript_36237/g.103978 Transcript_36237/m.103978 type:complete len:316 (+) Transcript_36237:458-1405(+)|eukprot:CEM24608.1 unnamed protein product [Vitrella brassicaformis CCMP3155]
MEGGVLGEGWEAALSDAESSNQPDQYRILREMYAVFRSLEGSMFRFLAQHNPSPPPIVVIRPSKSHDGITTDGYWARATGTCSAHTAVEAVQWLYQRTQTAGDALEPKSPTPRVERHFSPTKLTAEGRSPTRRAMLGEDELVERTPVWSVVAVRGDGARASLERLLGSSLCFEGRQHRTIEGNTQKNSVKVDEDTPVYFKLSPLRVGPAHICEAIFKFTSVTTRPLQPHAPPAHPPAAAGAAVPAAHPQPAEGAAVPAADAPALLEGQAAHQHGGDLEDDPQAAEEVPLFYAAQAAMELNAAEMAYMEEGVEGLG